MKSILIDGHTYHEGDRVLAELIKADTPDEADDLIEWYCGSEDDENDENNYIRVKGILNIKDDERCYICQDALSGANDADNDYGKDYSWSVTVRNGQIASRDIKWINPLITTPTFIVKENTELVEVDDDPMPDDWKLPFAIPEHL